MTNAGSAPASPPSRSQRLRRHELRILAAVLVGPRPFADASFAHISLSSLKHVSGNPQLDALAAELSRRVESLSEGVLTTRRISPALINGQTLSGLPFALLPWVCATSVELPIYCRQVRCFKIVRAQPFVRVAKPATWADLRRRYKGQIPGGFAHPYEVRCSCG